jgi:hypothetical protein
LQKCQGQHPPQKCPWLDGYPWVGCLGTKHLARCDLHYRCIYIYIWMQPSLKADLLQESKKGVPINAALFRALVRTVLRDATDNLHLPIRS